MKAMHFSITQKTFQCISKKRILVNKCNGAMLVQNMQTEKYLANLKRFAVSIRFVLQMKL